MYIYFEYFLFELASSRIPIKHHRQLTAVHENQKRTLHQERV